jgi:threonine-phosphate decarboxylase
MLLEHGGNIKEVADRYKIPQNKIIDFSSNINPLGFPHKIRDIIPKRIHLIAQYPDPEFRCARQGFSNYLGVPQDNLLLGNGSNELIHLIPRALNCSYALIYQPTFSEYELSIRLSGAKPYFIFAEEKRDFCVDIDKIINYVPKVDLIILCNPNNPTGYLLKKDELLDLLSVCKKNETYLLIDEVFMEFVEDQNRSSLIKEAIQERYLLVLRSLTKFFSLPGLRIGYLIADKELIRKISLFQPTWSVNALAQEIAAHALIDLSFIKKTQEYIIKERDFLFTQLKKITGICPYSPSANFIFCKLLDKKLDSHSLFRHLIKYGIVVRDCSNFRGLDSRFFRVAVRKRKENLYLIESLSKIFE